MILRLDLERINQLSRKYQNNALMGLDLETINQSSIKHQNYQTSRLSMNVPHHIQIK